MDNDKDLTELRLIGGDVPPPEDPRPRNTEDLIHRHKWLSHVHHKQMELKLDDFISDATSAGIPEIEVKEIFSEPLPPDDEKAKMALRDRMIGLYNSIDERKNNRRVEMGRALTFWKRLLDYDTKIRAFEPTLNEYIKLCERIKTEDFRYGEWMLHRFDEWKYGFGEQLKKLDEGEGQYISPRLRFMGEHTFDIEKLTELFKQVIQLYTNHYSTAEDLLHKQFPWIKKEVEELKNMDRALNLFPQIPAEAWDKGQRELKISDIDIKELKELTGKYRGEDWLNDKLDTLRWKAKCDISDLARLVSKSGKLGSKQAQIKAVKRKFRGLQPDGVDGKDFNKIEAKESHFKDGSAYAVGDPIFTFVKDAWGETKFKTKDVILYLHTEEQIKECYDQLYQEFKFNRLPGDPLVKPTAEDLGKEMGIHPHMIGMFLS